MITVTVFGGFGAAVDGVSRGAAIPRRLAAILGVLAWHGERGISRERLLHLLWSDAEPERARHALTQSLYAVKRLLGADDAIIGTAQLALNAERVHTDVAELEQAIAAHDATRAIACHRGPLLDGFSVNGAPELERWIDEQRAQSTQRLAAFLDACARTLQSEGQHAAAVTILRRRAALDPLDATATLGLMRAWALAGDTPAAVQHARVYGELVRQELELEPDPRVQSLARELAAAAAAVPAPLHTSDGRATVTPAAGHDLSAALDGWRVAVFDRARTLRASVARWWRKRTRRWITVARQALVTSVALVAVLLSFSRLARARRDAEPAPLATAVLPFRATGLSGDLSFLPSGIVDLLSVSMASRDSLAVVDPEVVHRWWDARAASGTITGADSLRRAAISLGVRQVVTGTLVGNARQLVIRATLMEGRTGRELAAAAVNGSLDSLPRLVDRLATLLVATAAGAGEVARLSLDADPHALRAYLRGRDAYRRADFSAAQSYFANALALDSSLAASSVGLALASDWLDDPRSRAEALDAALRWRARLPIVEQQQIAAMRGVRYPEPSSAADYFAGWERVARTGERPELWAELGRRLLADGRLAGVPDADARASEAFARALAIDSADAGTRVALVALAATHDSMAVPAGDVPNDTDPDRWFSAKWRRAAQASDGRAVERARQGIGAASDEALRRFALTALSDGEWLADGEWALRERGARARSTGTRVDAALAEHAYALNAGSPARALQATRRLGDLVSDGAHLRLRVLDALYADGDSAAALDALQRLTAHVHELPQASSTERSVMLSDLCVVEQWRLWHGDYSTVSVTIRALTVDAAAGPVDAAVASGHATCAYVVDAIAAGLQGSARAPDALARAEQLAMTGVSAGDMGQYATLALARVRDKRGELARALSLVRRRAVVRGWPRYLTSYLRLEASVAERLQDTVGATDALRHYLALRPAPDSSGMAEVEGARRKLRRLLAGQ